MFVVDLGVCKFLFGFFLCKDSSFDFKEVSYIFGFVSSSIEPLSQVDISLLCMKFKGLSSVSRMAFSELILGNSWKQLFTT